MGKITGFLEFDRKIEQYAPVEERIKNYKEFTLPMKEPALKDQGARCMDCGIPFCHSGCPLGNLIPDFNDARNFLIFVSCFSLYNSLLFVFLMWHRTSFTSLCHNKTILFPSSNPLSVTRGYF